MYNHFQEIHTKFKLKERINFNHLEHKFNK